MVSLISTRRDYLLQESFRLADEMKRLVDKFEAHSSQELEDRLEEIYRQRGLIFEEYRKGLPADLASRCPFCNKITKRTIDPFGIDGLWWDANAPIRRIDTAGCDHFFSSTGALQLAQKVEWAPHVAMPGPGAPFAVPEIIQADGVAAVIGSINIGAHLGYAVFYFSREQKDNLDRTNDWGAEGFEWIGADGRLISGTSDFTEIDYDYDLSRWINKRKLYWTKPNDSGLQLFSQIDGCPYLGVSGTHEEQWIQYTKVW